MKNQYSKFRNPFILILSIFTAIGLGIEAKCEKYYVSGTLGNNTNSAVQARSSSTPWQTLGFAISNAAVLTNDSIVVLTGTYSETNIGITKSLKIFGNETAGTPGVGSKPVFNGSSSTPAGSIFLVQSPNVIIKNFQLQVNQSTTIRGIFSAAGGFNQLRIEDNHIFSTGSSFGTIFNSFGIQLGQPSFQAGVDSFLIVRNIIRPLGAFNAVFGRGIRLVGGYGKIGGDLLSDSNQIQGTYAIQSGDARRALQVLNNHLIGSSATLEINFPSVNRIHKIEGNTFNPLPDLTALTMIEIKNNIGTNSIISINNNKFIGFQVNGIFSTRSRNVQVTNNTFIPSDTSRNFIHIAANTKQQTSANDPSTTCGIVATGNTFQSNAFVAGVGISFQNHNSGAIPPFANVQLGGPGALANTFGQNLSTCVALDSAGGNSKKLPLWNQASYRVTTMLPTDIDLDVSQNNFNVGTGQKLPSAMTNAELLLLEDKIVHGIDFDSLGFLTVIPNQAFVTKNSFLSPKTNTPSLQRAVDATNSDAWTILAEPFTYPENVTVDKTITIQSEPMNSINVQGLTMNGAGKTLTLDAPVSISNLFSLTQGLIKLNASDLTWNSVGTLTGGNPQSYVFTSGIGKLVYSGLNSTKVYHIGTATSYFPTTLSNTGISDAFGLRVVNDVFAAGLTGIAVDSAVGATWVLNEANPGGSNLTFATQWTGANEKTGFTRSSTALQGFTSNWANLSGLLGIAATGADPYQISFSGLTNTFTNLPLRIRNFAQPAASGRLYYVDNATGDDSRTNTEAKDPATPWKTIANSIAQTISGDSIQVFAGTYSEFDLRVNKSLTILGNVLGVGVGPGAGTGVKPVVNGAGPSLLDSSIFIVTATNVNIRNFNIKVDQLNIKLGINAPRTGYGGIIIEDNLIESTRNIVGNFDVIVMSHAILLGRLFAGPGIIANGNDSVIVRRNIIDREGPNKMWFSRGVRWWGGRGLIGGNSFADGNTIHADFAIQIGGGIDGGRIQTRNNNVFGRAAGIEYNTLPPTFRHTIANNTIQPLDLKGHFALIEIKSNIRTTGPTAPAPPFIDIENNTFLNFYKIGVASTRSRNINVMNNTFTPAADSTNYTHVWLNTKQRTSGAAAAQPPLSVIETLIQGNTFNSNNVVGGFGVAFQNANASGSGVAFTSNTMGGAGALANTFGPNIAKVVYLDTVSGPSSLNSFWSKPGINWTIWPSTPMKPVKDNFDFSGNLFDVGTGSKRPEVMTSAELFLLENRVVHKVDADSLGFVTMKPNNVYVTLQSFIAPLTISPRIQRALNATGTTDGFTVNIETGTYNGGTSVTNTTTFDATPDGEVVLDSLQMNGSGKVLSLNDPFKVSSSLILTQGIIDILSSDLSVLPAATVTGGSLTAHVRTAGTGYFVYTGLAGTAKRYPIGTATRYAEVELRNTGTADDLGVKLKDDVLSAGLTGIPVDSVVGITYQLREGIAGGSGLNFKATWNTADEKPFFDRSKTFVQQFNSSWQNIGGGAPVAATGSDPFSINSDIVSNWSGQAIRISSNSAATPGNIYYVSNSGDDSRSNDVAKNPATPWLTIGNGLLRTSDGDSIQVFSGTYPESNLRITKAVKLFGNVIGVGTGVGAGTGVRPIVNGTTFGADSSIFTVASPDVLIRNFQIEVNQNLIINGISARSSNYNRIQILGNRILSTGINPGPPTLPCLRFNTYGIRLVGFSTDSLLIQGNEIEPSITDGTRCAFGRGIKLFGGHGLIGGPNDLDSNRILAYYDIQAGDIDGGRLIIENNFSVGIGVQIVGPAANSGIHIVRNNNFFLSFPEFFPTMAELKDIQNVGTGLLITKNNFVGFINSAIFSQQSQNVSILDNNFIPASTASNYRHIIVNTKQETIAPIQAPRPSSIQIKSNRFFGNGIARAGTAIEFGNYNDDPTTSIAFANTSIGGAGAEANTFDQRIGKFFVLDPLFGASSTFPFWSTYPSTSMVPVKDTFDISNNLFGVSGGIKLPSAMNDTENYELEDKVVHAIDYDSLGFVTWKPAFAYVTDSSFLKPFKTSPSLGRAVAAAGNKDGWQINIEPSSIDEIVLVKNSMTWNTFPLDSVRLGGISINGQDKVLTLQDQFILTSSLNLNNPNGGKISISDKDLVALTAATVSPGSSNSYVITNGLGGLVKRGITDVSFDFPVGTNDQFGFAPVNFDDENNTGDEFKVNVRPTPTNADFTPPLPLTITTFAKFQWTICEKIPGGSTAQLRFDYSDPSNVVGSEIINGIARNDGTNWTRQLGSVSGFVVRASGYTTFCSPFAVIGDPSLTSIETKTIIKDRPVVAGKFCLGDNIKIPFTVTGNAIILGNVFNAFLSDADGTFPVNGGALIGSLVGNTSDTIRTRIPFNTILGSNYRIRVRSTAPEFTGEANPDSIKIFGLPARPQITGDSVICQGNSLRLTSTVSDSYVWAPNGQLSQSIDVSSSGQYQVRITDLNGCTSASAIRNISINSNPVVQPITFSGSLNRCVGDSIVLTANPSGLTYRWLNTLPSVTTRDLIVKNAGSFSVIVSNAGGCSDTSVAVVSVFDTIPAKPVISAANANVCQPDSLVFQTISGFTYAWSIPGISPNPATNLVIVKTVGDYNAIVTITDANGCKNVSDIFNGKLRQAPIAPQIISVNSDLSVCQGTNIDLQASPFFAGNTYNWLPGAPFQGPVLTLSAPGLSIVSVSVDSNGCTTNGKSSVTANINLKPLPPTASVVAGTNSFCQGDSASLQSSVASNYEWLPGLQSTQGIVVNISGSYSVVAISDSGCRSDASNVLAIEVRQLPTKPVIFATRGEFCQGQDATISVVNVFAGNTYTWSNATVANAIVVNASGKYSIRSDSSNNCSSSSDSVGIIVNPIPIPVISATGDKFAVCKGNTVELRSNILDGNSWSTNPLQTTQSIFFQNSASNIILTVTDTKGCQGTTQPVSVTIFDLPTVKLLKDTTLTVGAELELKAVNLPDNAETFLWKGLKEFSVENQDTTFAIKPSATNIYTVVVTDENGCVDSSSILVRVSSEIYIPNMFSPNNDGSNDKFKIYGFGVDPIGFDFKVWDRLGNLVFQTSEVDDIVETSESDDKVMGWDGKFKGKLLGSESYIWSVKGKFNTGEALKVRGGNNSGSVLLMN